MVRHLPGWWSCFLLLVFVPLGGAQTSHGDKIKEEVLALGRRIDGFIEARCKEAGVELAPPASDSVYFRRLNLDLGGRIPTLTAARDFVDDPDPHKRWDRVNQLLAQKTYGEHFARVWRAHLLSNSNNQFLQGLTPGFDLWLNDRLINNVGYDKIVHEILSTPANVNMNVNFNGQLAGSPAAFFLANENKPENLAGATTRVFLGVKLECAQCHSHPFAKWTRDQFWEFAAFYASTPQNFRGAFQQAAIVDPNRREIQIPGTNKTVKAKFLTGQEPNWKEGGEPRKVLADWITSSDNPYFARATVDQLWSYFFGVSLLEPILEPNEEAITHADLLDEMARELVIHKFDLKFLIQAIVHTKAYQRSSSASAKVGQEEHQLFARMPVRGLTPEQLYDSVLEATYQQETPAYMGNPQNFFNQLQSPRAQFLAKFTSQEKRNETQTSILQALFLMNGKAMAERLRPENNVSLGTLIRVSNPTEKKLETLFLMVLSRLPRPEESARLVRYIESGDQRRTIPDVYWALLNSAEFMLNH
jgi:hypothetical protein